jgi:prepilin-type N-terminal cleavage/methylation domain-containing protein
MDRVRRTDDGGFTLVEVLMSLLILGIAFSGILTGLATNAIGSNVHRKHTNAETALRSWAESVSQASYQTACTTAVTSYSAATLAVNLSGYTASPVTLVSTTAGSTAWGGSCTNAAALQKVTLTVTSPDGKDFETTDVVKYKP